MKKLTKIYNAIPEEIINNGKNWYKDANLFAARLSNDYKISFDRVCAVISALSPANNWENNKTEAEKLIVCYVCRGNWENLTFRTYSSNVEKAWSILLEIDKPTQSFFSVKTGAKTLNFYNNILDPSNNSFITIDRHMIAIISGNIGKLSGSQRITPKQYKDVANELIKVSNKFKLLPCQFQAILWEYHLSLINND